MRTIPVDTNAMTLLIGGVIQPATNSDGTQRLNAAGKALFQVPVVVVTDGANADTIVVRVPGPVAHIEPLTPVKFVGLVARPWSIDGRSGVAFAANALQATSTKQ